MTIGSNIKRIRREKKLTQTELAKKINKGLRTVQKYESDDINIPIDILKDISKALNVELIELIADDTHSIYIDFIADSIEDTFKKLYAISRDEKFMKDILLKEKHELNLFEQCLLIVYDDQEHDVSILTEIFKFLSSDILQEKLGYSFKDLASSETDLIRISLNIINSIKNDLKNISDSKRIVDDINKGKINKTIKSSMKNN